MAHDRTDVLNLINELVDSETPVQSRRLPKARKVFEGNNTRLPMSVWLGGIFELNELHATKRNLRKVLYELQIRKNFEGEFGGKEKSNCRQPGGAILSGKHTVGTYRKRYRMGTLYKGQPKPILISLKYSDKKLPLHDGPGHRYLTFNDIRALCLQCFIADPRFFTPDELKEIEDHATSKGDLHAWGIPTHKQWQELERCSPGGVYACITTYERWKNNDIADKVKPI